MKSLIVARKKEQLILNQLLQEPTAQFLAVYGRPQPLRDEVIMVVKQKTPTPCNKKKTEN